jgi:glutamate synthase domain-containing protein 2
MTRYFFFWLVLLATAASIFMALQWGGWLCYLSTVMLSGLSLLGIADVLQAKQAIRRNYPILSHLRFLFEEIRPEIRQYFLEGDNEEIPFSRQQRAIVYQRAKNTVDKRAFGTQLDVYQANYEWINHSIMPSTPQGPDFRVQIGSQSTQKYSASVFNISAMSFGALSANAIRALNKGAKQGGFYHDTGEGSISRYHREHGGDLVWEIGSGYFGCRNPDGSFSESMFTENALAENVKMIELKLSQGAKPGHGGVLPGAKVTPEIAEARGVMVGEDCVSPARHSAFDSPITMLQFIARLRALSGGKPIGFKLAIGHPWEFFALCKAMQQTGIVPDFIVVDGGEGGTGAAPLEFTDHVGAPLREGLLLVHNTLVGLNLRDQIKIGASGKVITAFDVARTMALGADWCNAARGFMFSLGCIQAQVCHTGKCPTGVTTQDPQRQRALDVPDKSERVFQFHRNTLHALQELVAAAGLQHPSEIGPEHIIRRVSSTEVRSLASLHNFVAPGELLSSVPAHPAFQAHWAGARADSFNPPADMLRLRASKSQ